MNKTSARATDRASGQHDFLVVGIGASAGGIKALKEFFAAMPSDSGMAFVVILHLSDEHESSLAQILQALTTMVVAQVTQTVKVEPNHVYVIPPAKGLAMVDGHLELTELERIKGKRVPIDLFFRTLADAYGEKGIAVILSGTGSDGTLGLKRVKENGGIGIAQEPSEAEYDGMPQSAINTGLVDLILPVGEMPDRIIGLRDNGARIRLPQEKNEIPRPQSEEAPDALHEILAFVHTRTGHDFSNYKHATVLRRIARRLQVHGLAELPEYLAFLRANPDEAGALQRDLLITVTNFFRDKEAFEALEKEVLPQLFAGKTHTDTVRVWSVGTATGDEAYSLAMLLDEYAASLTDAPKIQIFASDINEEAIATARERWYDEPIVADVAPERLRRYFVKEGKGWRIRKELRDLILFAPHNILRDPAFSKLDLITCRNLLIYFNPETQNAVLKIFNFALRRDGFLFLGSSESTEQSSALFSVVDKPHRIFKVRPAAQFQLPALPSPGKWNVRIPPLPVAPNEPPPSPISYGEIHNKLVEQFAPPSVLVNEEYEIVHVSEHAGRFLRVVGGEPTRNLIKTVHPALKLDLQGALFEAKKGRFVTESRNVRLEIDGQETLVNITVRLLQSPNAADGFYLVIFDESKNTAAPVEAGEAPQTIVGRDAMQNMVRQLEHELQINRERLRATVEHSGISTEELKASNEELQAINEELRSASEELETSKEEFQSLNEELLTVNVELKDKVEQLNNINSDLQNIVQSTDIGTIFLDRSLRVKRYTPRVADLFNIIPSDLGRPLEHLTHKLDYDSLTEDAIEVLQTLQMKEREVRGGTGDRRYLIRMTPYRTLDDKIEGAVLSFQDITDIKRANDLLMESEERFAIAFNASPLALTITALNTGKLIEVNETFVNITGYSRAEAIGRSTAELGLWLQPSDREAELATVTKEGQIRTTEYRFRMRNGREITGLLSAELLEIGGEPCALTVIQDITERKQAEELIRESEEKFRNLANSISQFAWMTDAAGYIFWYNERWFEYTGTTLEEMQGWGWQKVHHPDEVGRVVEKFQQHIASGEEWEDTFPLRSKTGEYRWFLSRALPIRDENGNIVRWFGTNTDIEDVRLAEEKLKDADRRKDEFLATLAHELRNPLAPIRAGLEIMRRGNEAQIQQAQSTIVRQLTHIIRLVDDLLDVSRISRGKITLQVERVELAGIIHMALETNHPLLEAAGHELTVALPPVPVYLDGDPTRLVQIVLNLMNNAVKYTEPGGKIALRATTEHQQAVIRIKDSGIGIPAKMLPHIFDIFTQAEHASQQMQGGLGIGLSLVKNLVEMHGGTIEAFSDSGGSEFIVRLPLALAQQPTSQPLSSEKTAAVASLPAQYTILVVDDNVDAAEMMEVILTMEGHEVLLAYDGTSAIKTALEQRPAVAVLDIGLPDLDGYEVARQIRQHAPDILLIALSGWGQEEDRRQSQAAGFDHHLVKPVDSEALHTLLQAKPP